MDIKRNPAYEEALALSKLPEEERVAAIVAMFENIQDLRKKNDELLRQSNWDKHLSRTYAAQVNELINKIAQLTRTIPDGKGLTDTQIEDVYRKIDSDFDEEKTRNPQFKLDPMAYKFVREIERLAKLSK